MSDEHEHDEMDEMIRVVEAPIGDEWRATLQRYCNEQRRKLGWEPIDYDEHEGSREDG